MERTARIVIVQIIVSAVGVVAARDYFVDYDGGADTNAGTSPDTAFKHAPGDPAATDSVRALVLRPGDRLVFKGGVIYRGSVNISVSGEAGKPIVYDGNTDGTFGRGRAIVDGSERVDGWKRCASAEECGGNPNWEHIYYASLSGDPDVFTINPTQGNETLSIAQDPNPEDPFFEDMIASWRNVIGPGVERDSALRIRPGKGMAENPGRPYVLAFDGRPDTSAVVDPCAGAELTVECGKAVTATRVAVAASQRPYTVPKGLVILADGEVILEVTLEEDGKLQEFDLPEPVTFKELALRIVSAYPGGPGYGALAEFQAFDAEGRNLLLTKPTSTYVDPGYFTQLDPHPWDGAYFLVYARPNLIYYQKVLGYDPERRRLTFELLAAGQYPVGGSPAGKFSMMNSLAILDRPGEFVLDERPQADGMRRIYVWPPGERGEPAGTAVSRRASGFEVKGASNVVIQGFRIQKQGGTPAACGVSGGGAAGVIVRDDEVLLIRAARNQVVSFTDSKEIAIVENHIHHNRRAGGIHMTRCKDSGIRNNTLDRNGATGLSLYTCERIEVAANVVMEHKGMHANGLTAYLGCSDVRFLNNTIVRSAGDSDWAVGIYANRTDKPLGGYVMRNNIIDGTCWEAPLAVERSNNIYTRKGANEAKPDWRAGPGEIFVEDLSALFVAPERGDFRLKARSPAIDAGVDVGLKEDIAGTKVPQGEAPDIGAFEYEPCPGRQPSLRFLRRRMP